ncbi:MAG: hypothetical protein HY978_01940 [Candidatus Liptonbacteria bacterium]|nr:hypothetical protein [Candidatus Liptonbacteria bacterium]
MKGDWTIQILEGFKQAALDLPTALQAFLESGYGASAGKMIRRFDELQNQKLIERQEDELFSRERRRFYNLVSWLKKDGLVEAKRRPAGIFYRTTSKGLKKLEHLYHRKSSVLPAPRYSGVPSNRLTIVSYDIPERHRRKRRWVSACLLGLGFQAVHRSVYLGKVVLPREFIQSIGRLKLAGYLEIFEITKSGTLRRLTEPSTGSNS